MHVGVCAGCWVLPPLTLLSDLNQLVSIKFCEIPASPRRECGEWAQGHQTLSGLSRRRTVHFGRDGSFGAHCSPLGVFWPLSSWFPVAFLEDQTSFLWVMLRVSEVPCDSSLGNSGAVARIADLLPWCRGPRATGDRTHRDAAVHICALCWYFCRLLG